MTRGRALAAAIAAALCIGASADPSGRLHDPGQEARARHPFPEPPCVVCGSINNSDADIADALRVTRETVRRRRQIARERLRRQLADDLLRRQLQLKRQAGDDRRDQGRAARLHALPRRAPARAALDPAE